MTIELDIAPELRKRLDAVAARLNLSPSDIVVDALEYGHSLEWQEKFLQKMADGIAAADAGDFASPKEIERIRGKYRPV